MGLHPEEDGNPLGLLPTALFPSVLEKRQSRCSFVCQIRHSGGPEILNNLSTAMQGVCGAETRAKGSEDPNVFPLASEPNETRPELQAFYSVLAGLYKNTLFRKINSSCPCSGGLESLELKSPQSQGSSSARHRRL